MEDKAKSRLDALFNAQAAEQSAHQTKENAEKAAHDAQAAEFKAIAEGTIKPAMQEVLESLAAKGIRGRLTEGDGVFKDYKRDSFVQMSVFPEGSFGDGGDAPHLRATMSKGSRSVQMSFSTMMPRAGGQTSTGGIFSFEDISGDLIQEKAVDVLEKSIFRSKNRF